MKIFAQLICSSTGQRSPAFSGTKEELAVVFWKEWNRRCALLDEKFRVDPSEQHLFAPEIPDLAVLVLMDNVESPADMRFSTCPIMTVPAFHKWVFPELPLTEHESADVSADRV